MVTDEQRARIRRLYFAEHWCYRARLLMEIWPGWLMGINEDERAWSRLADGHQ